MKSFLKYTLATIVGIMIVHVILFFIFIGFIGAIASFSEKTVTVKNNSILTINWKEKFWTGLPTIRSTISIFSHSLQRKIWD